MLWLIASRHDDDDDVYVYVAVWTAEFNADAAHVKPTGQCYS